jgi:hypothetical protein
VIIGHRTKLVDVRLDEAEYMLVGGYGSGEGTDVAPLTAERIRLLPFLEETDFEVWQVVHQVYESERDVEIPAGTYDIESLNASYHTIEPSYMPEYYGVDKYAIMEAILNNKPIPSLILDALEERERALIGLWQRGEIQGEGVFEKIWEGVL